MFNLWRINKKAVEPQKVEFSGLVNSKNVKQILGDSDDIIIREIYTGRNRIKVTAIGIDGMIDSEVIDENVIRPLTIGRVFDDCINEKDAFNLVNNGILYHISQEEVTNINEAVRLILQGVTVVFFDNINKAVSFDAKSIPQRGIETPQNESVLKGAKDSFIESLRTNTALVRKKIKSPLLRFEKITIGKETQTPVDIVYLNGITDDDILNKLREKLKNMDVSSMISAGSFEENIRDHKYSILPEVLFTERVDKFCANITDGKVGVLIDGLPIGYIIPGIFAMFLQAPEDYSQNYFISSATRVFRYFCMLLSLILPGFYIAITTFHQEMIPSNLMMAIIKSKEGVPFATAFEIFGMLLAFELLVEASLRLPKTIGATISIIGGLIVGEAAVNAQFISPTVVVIIAIAGITGFVIPNQDLANTVRICRLYLTLCAAFLGLFGISFGLLTLLYYLCTIETFGVPYLIPFVANEGKNELNDTVIRLPRDLSPKKNEV